MRTVLRSDSTRKRLWALALVPVALVAAGCGGGDDESDGALGTTQPPAPVETTTTVPPSTAPPTTDPARVARAQAATLKQSDFPTGFKEQPPEEGLFLNEVWQDVTRCLGVENQVKSAATATSPTFVQGLATQVRTRVDYMSPADANAVAVAFDSPKVNECLTAAFTADADRSKPDGAVPGPSTVSPLEVPQAGTKTFARRVNVTMDLGGLQVPIFQDFIVVFDEDGAVIPMFFLNPGNPFPPTLERSLVEKVVSRA